MGSERRSAPQASDLIDAAGVARARLFTRGADDRTQLHYPVLHCSPASYIRKRRGFRTKFEPSPRCRGKAHEGPPRPARADIRKEREAPLRYGDQRDAGSDLDHHVVLKAIEQPTHTAHLRWSKSLHRSNIAAPTKDQSNEKPSTLRNPIRRAIVLDCSILDCCGLPARSVIAPAADAPVRDVSSASSVMGGRFGGARRS